MANHFRILSIDGGGIRGILPGQVMVSLEKKLQQKSGNANARIADYFDMLAGTSTGGILTCLYLCPSEKDSTRPLFSAQDAVNLYLQYGKDIFKDNIRQKLRSLGGLTDQKYSAVSLEKLLKKYFKETKLSQLLKPCIIPSYNIFGRTTHFFTQHDAKTNPGYDFLLRDVARATSAAPTFFEPARTYSMTGASYPLVDGGVFANNPALCAYAEARQKFSRTDGSKNVTAVDMFILSIGTGSTKRSYDYDRAKGWGALGWIQPILDIMMSGASDTIDFQLKQIFDAANSPKNYVRLNPEIGEAQPEMDDSSLDNMEFLKEAGIAAAEQYDTQLESIADYLVNSKAIV